MKDVITEFLNNLKSSFVGIIAIIGFIVTLLFPDVRKNKIEISIAIILLSLLLLYSIAYAFWKTFDRFYNKTFKFIEINKSDSGNDVYWFTSDYKLNIGDIVKIVQYNENGSLLNLCIAKVQYVGDNSAIGLLPLAPTSHLATVQNNSSSLKRNQIKPVHINSEEIKQLLFLINKDNKEKNEVNTNDK